MAQAVGGCALKRQPALTHTLSVEIAYGVVRAGTYRSAGAAEQRMVRAAGSDASADNV